VLTEKPMAKRRHLCGLLLAACVPALALAQTDAWPARPIHLVIAYPPGGATDVAGRLLAEALGPRLGQPVLVDNRAGAGGTIGAQSVVRAEPDGYTLLLAASPEVSIAPVTMKAMPYDPVKDLQPIALVGSVPFLLVVNPGVPANTLQELVAYAKANPGKLNYSSFGKNTSNHLAGELFKSMAQIDTVHIPYKGSGPSITDLLGGQVQYTFDAPPAVLAQVKAGKLRALAVAANERLGIAPTVPTFAEAGLPGFVAGTWFGLLAPARTPRAIIDKVNAATVSLLAGPELRQAFAERGIIAAGDSPEQFGQFIRAEVGKWRALAERVGIVAE
jgi:tripartite-type tricarboxylate transporter receptor subunit TctC